MVEETGMKKITIFTREQGPICYEAPLFHRPTPHRATLPAELLSSNLDWLWHTITSDVPPTSTPLVPVVKRPITMLTESNVDALLEDMRTGLLDGEGDYIALIGVEPGTAHHIRDDTQLRSALHDFSAHERGPVHIVAVQLGDAYVDYLFVPHNPSEATVNLLDAWGFLNPNLPVKMRRYRDLRTARLESLYELSSKAE